MSIIRLKNKLKHSRYAYDNEGYVIHMLTSNERTFFTNAYIIETENPLVVVDTMMINSDALLLRQHINNINKPLLTGAPLQIRATQSTHYMERCDSE
jgi:hypothetical protein